jgi:LmbE family N-acetylglucosaminyl deacetylase
MEREMMADRIEHFKRVLVFGAHPDDEIVGCGGTIARLAQAGSDVSVVTFTGGGTSGAELSDESDVEKLRANEAARADEILGVRERQFLGIATQSLNHDRATHQATMRAIRAFQPDLILTHFRDRHKDHTAAFHIVPSAAWQASEEILMEECGPPHFTPQVWFYEIVLGFSNYSYAVDITATFDKKVAAMRTQLSQTRTGHMENTLRLMEGRAMARGADIAVQYAEAFLKCNLHPTPL